MSSAPPAVATWLLEQMLPTESREAVVGDLVERYHGDAATQPIRARLRFWREALSAILELQVVPDRVSAFTPYVRESRMQSFLSDLRQAVRVLSRARAFTLLCTATLGIAIGATATILSVVTPLLLQPIPYPDPDRLVMVHELAQRGERSSIGYASYSDLRRDSRSLRSSAAFGSWEPTLFGEHDSERVRGQRVTWEYFRTLGVQPAIGRDFLEADDTPDASTVVIISHGLWTRRFGGDPAVIGRPVNISGATRTIVGVMPRSFDNVLDPTAQIWRVLGYADGQDWACRTCRHLRMIARLSPTATPVTADQELGGLMARMAAAFPTEYADGGAVTEPLRERVTAGTRPIFLAIIGATTLLLLIAITNVVNLQLARAARRDDEFAVRAALGAGHGRLTQQLLAEGLVIAACAGAAGMVVAGLGLPWLVAMLPEDLPRLNAIGLDWLVFVVVAGIVLIVALAVGLVSALHAARRGSALFGIMRGSARTVGLRHHRTRGALVVGEIALAMLLVVGAALLGRTLARLLAVDMGFDPTRLVTMEVQSSGARYPEPAHVYANHDRIREVVRAVPGVLEVGLASQLPLGGNVDRYGVVDRANPLPNPALAPYADRYAVSADFMRAMRIPLVRGRPFTDSEARDSSARVAIVSEALAARMWPADEAIGQFIRLGGPDRPFFRVIGVARNVRHTGLDETGAQQVYVPERQWFWAESPMVLVARVQGDAARMIPKIRDAVRSVDPQQPIARIATMDDVVERSVGQQRLGLVLFACFGGIALLLASGGIYGVLAGSVTDRTREIGVRTALGATPGAILAMVMRQGLAFAIAGLLIGTAGALVLSRFLQSLLFGVGTADPVAMGAAATIIFGVCVVACLAPARRAARTDPMSALRSD